MPIQEITNQKSWDKFVVAHGSQFLQSWDWGQFQVSLGRKIWRLGLMENNQIKAAALVVRHSLPLKMAYFYSPRGPIVTSDSDFTSLLATVTSLAKSERAIFYRLEPTDQKLEIGNWKSGLDKSISNFKFQFSNPVQPAQTMILDLTKPENELLSSFHQKTRYNINLAEKKGVTAREGKTKADFEIFWNLLQKTYQKQKISTHPKEYYQKILDTRYQILDTKLFIAEYQNKPIAANLCYFYGATATYAHGGTDYAYRHLMAPHLLQWRQIKIAKALGYKIYDFWGFDPKKWPGVSRFKQGFNGQVINYPGTFDLSIKKSSYQAYRLLRSLIA